MQPIANIPLFPVQKVSSKARNEREEYLEKFAARINASRKRDGYKPLPISKFAAMLSHLTIQDLHAFYKSCAAAGNFSRCFWGKLKVK